MRIHKIEPGQVYRSIGRKKVIRVKVTKVDSHTPGLYGSDKVTIGTITEQGRVIRERHISFSQLHYSSKTNTGQSRRNGYVLENQEITGKKG